MLEILRGEIWLLDLDPTVGHEQAGTRPALVISENIFNQSRAELIIIVPITSKERKIRSHVRIEQGDGGLPLVSFAKCEAVRSVSKERFMKKYGRVCRPTIEAVEQRLRFLMAL